MESTIDKARLREVLALCSVWELRYLIQTERIAGRAFGVTAEACRDELAKRCERE